MARARRRSGCMAYARREFGDEYVDTLYRSIGRLRHEEQKDISENDVLIEAIEEVGLDPEILKKGDGRSCYGPGSSRGSHRRY